jgi:hypothetical protein
MSIIYTETLSDAESRTEIDIGDGRRLTINITGEGIIMDVWGTYVPGTEPWTDNETGIDESLLGTAGMMFDEWADWIVAEEETTDIDRKYPPGIERGQELLNRDFLPGHGGAEG